MSERDTSRLRGKRKILGVSREAEPLADEDPGLAEGEVQPAPPPPEDAHAYHKLQLGFFVAVVVGLLTALLGYVQGLEAIGFAGPMLSIIGFYVFGKLQGFVDRGDTRQQFADSCYFLGFLLTMIAMLVGFLPAGLFQQPITSQGILRHFSIALGATALGLVFRILVLQGGRTLGQITAEVETGLTRYARRVSDEARAIGEELADLRLQLEAQREQVGTIVSKDLKEVAEAAFAPIARSVTKIADNLEAQSANIANSASDLQDALNRSAEQITQAADVQGDASDAAHAAIASVTQALHKFDARMAELRSQLAQVVTSSTDEIAKMTDALQKGTELAPSLAPALETMTSTMSAVSTQLGDLRAESAKVAQRISDTLSEDNRLLDNLDVVQEQVVGGIRDAGSQAASEITREGELTRNELQQVRVQFTEHLNQDREAFGSEISRATDRLAEILQAFAARIEEVRAGATR